MSNVTQLNVQTIDSKRSTIVDENHCFNKKLFEECPDWVNLQGAAGARPEGPMGALARFTNGAN